MQRRCDAEPVLVFGGQHVPPMRPPKKGGWFAVQMFKPYDGHFHDLLRDVDKEIVMADSSSFDLKMPCTTSAPTS